MSEFNDSEVQQIVVQIESYLANHPHAADTLEGISKWWLPGKRIEVSRPIVQLALDYLEAKSVIKFNYNPSGNRVYSRNKSESQTE
jgi:hypothetical protein